MLKIRHLFKTFPKSRNNKEEVKALKDLNLTFERNELVFIVGKSGSGKSTLLNIIGTLDKPTSGELSLYNKKYSSMKSKDIDALRQNVAFIFQDFALIDELNVFDNIKMSRNDVSKEDVLNALKRVELEGFEFRKIKTLSAGQKQRVAIARSIVKNPKIILCDEPTGNLDFVTSQAILKCLKEISKDVLVLLVSHNLDDAYTYGSRIIELEDGNLIKDIVIDDTHVNKPYVIKDDGLYLTTVKSINDDELDIINSNIKENKIRFINPKRKLFKDYEYKESENVKEFDNKHRKIKFKDLFKTSHKLLKRQYVKTIIFSLLSALILSIFAIAFQISTFDKNDYVYKSIEEMKYYSYTLKSSAPLEYGEYRIPLIEGYEEMLEGEKNKDYFEIIPIDIDLSMTSYLSSNATWSSPYVGSYYSSVGHIYPYSFYGTLIMNEEEISKNFNNNKGFEVLESADTYQPYGVYIIDVVADILKKANKPYLGQIYSNASKTFKTGYVNGVIKSNFYDLYPNAEEVIYKKYSSFNSFYEAINTDNELKHFIDVFETMLFYISTEDNFVEHFMNAKFHKHSFASYYRTFPAFEKYLASLSEEDRNAIDYKFNKIGHPSPQYHKPKKEGPNVKEIIMGTNWLNQQCGVTFTAEEWKALIFNSGDATFSIHFNPFVIKGQDMTTTYTSTIIDVKDSVSSIEYYDQFMAKSEWMKISNLTPCGILTFDEKFIANNMDKFNDANLTINNDATFIGEKVADTVTVYKDLFDIILYLSLVIVIVVVIFISCDAVKRQSYNIGVLKSLGVRNKEIFTTFSFHEAEFIISSFILTFIFEVIFINLANNVLLFAIDELYEGFVPTIPLIEFTLEGFLYSLGIVFASSIVAYLLSLFVVKSYKPINILKSKY